MARKQVVWGMFVLGLCLLSRGTVWAQPVVQVRYDLYPPWVEGAYGQPATGGLAMALLDELAHRMHLRMKSELVPFARALKLLEQGKADVMPMMLDKPERRRYAVFSLPIYVDPILVSYTTRTTPAFAWQQWADLKPYRIGIVRGNAYGAEWDEQSTRQALRVEVVKDDLTNARKLALGRIDLALIAQANLLSMRQAHPQLMADVKASAKPVTVWVYRIGIAKTSFLAARLAEVNETLQAMKDDGTVRRLFGAYYTE